MNQSTSQKRFTSLKVVAAIEGLSYLVLLFVAMPMKYIAGEPEMVRVVGMAHGVLFVLFAFVLIQTKLEHRLTASQTSRVFATAFIPFGMFLIDRALAEGRHADR